MISVMIADAGAKRGPIVMANRSHWKQLVESGITEGVPADLDSWGLEALSTSKYHALYGGDKEIAQD